MPNLDIVAAVDAYKNSPATKQVVTPDGARNPIEVFEIGNGQKAAAKPVIIPPVSDPSRETVVNEINNEIEWGGTLKKHQDIAACAVKLIYQIDPNGTERQIMIMPKVDGKALSFVDEADLIKRGAELARNLNTLNSAEQMVHGDLKPENILVDGAGPAILIDFGSTVTNGIQLQSLTPEYSSPEGIQGQLVDGKHDVYGLASIMAQHYMGETPNELLGMNFSDTTKQENIRNHLRSRVKDPQLGNIIIEGLNIDPSRRPSMEQFAQRLESLSSDRPFPHLDLKELQSITSSEQLGRFLRKFADADCQRDPNGGIRGGNFKPLTMIADALGPTARLYDIPSGSEKADVVFEDLEACLARGTKPRLFNGGLPTNNEATPLEMATMEAALALGDKISELDPDLDSLQIGRIFRDMVQLVEDPDKIKIQIGSFSLSGRQHITGKLYEGYSIPQAAVLRR